MPTEELRVEARKKKKITQLDNVLPQIAQHKQKEHENK